MTTQDLTIHSWTKCMKDNTTDKKQLREVVKTALYLYRRNKISKDTLDYIAEMAMIAEISAGFEVKLKKKADRLLCLE